MNDSVRQARRRATRTGCAVEATLSVLGGIWKPVLMFHLLEGRLRFNALCRLTPNATPRMVTIQLRELEADGVVRRIVYPEVPPRVEYELTDFGRTLEPVLISLRDWGEALQARDNAEAALPLAPPGGAHSAALISSNI
ncbi:DNA-binding transcriptional regulator, HxlR family [Bosea sp. CRIB-10]|uniref:winged helix-turn-helix transcriptional regulator n=1 Tax=Bosea sp. CRIB-10 TaxID=378404 RepID=UPI0008F05D2A|nr:helix-turn-helix domain-containing protein [Bosea sp. CRIB-10]SFD43909.1 DNA-binding transcriptional regulator, HxlR family [Bosea sp. CRIB-10]